MHPQTGKEIDDWACAIAWMPVLQIETAQQTRQVGAATESFRNEMVRANADTVDALLTARGKDVKVITGS